MTVKRVRALVSGHVQGVSYRWSTVAEADRLGVHGWVRNLDDGRVEFEAEGESDAVDALVAWAESGPDAASVLEVQTVRQEPTGERGFRTLYSSGP